MLWQRSPRHDFRLILAFHALFAAIGFESSESQCHANPTLVTRSGDLAVGAAQFAGFSDPVINESGGVAFIADLEQGVGSVDATNDTGVWMVENQLLTTITREGFSSVPGVANAQYDQFQSLSLSNSGDVLLQAKLRPGFGGITGSNRYGLWKLGMNSSLLVQSGASTPAGVPGSSFVSLGSPLFEGGVVATTSQLTLGPSVNNENDRGLWSYGSISGATLLTREGTTAAPGVANATFLAYGLQGVNENGAVVSKNALNLGAGVTTAERLGLWKHSSSGGVLVARQGTGSVAGVSGGLFETFEDSTINTGDAIAFSATLRHSGSVSASNDRGIWLFNEGSTELLAREEETQVPGVLGASFLDFGSPHLNDAGQVFIQSELLNGVGGVDATNNHGIWRLENTSGTSELIARVGSGGVPEIAGANFENFASWTFNDSGQVAFTAELEVGPGGVIGSTSQGIWILDPLGDSKLVARTGDVIAGETIVDLSLSPGKTVGTRALNDSGDLVYRAEFASGSSGLFLYEAPNELSPADFNESGLVDGGDLLLWRTNFGTLNGLPGDADEDGDVEGLDFLAWQQAFEGSAGQATAVPEPLSLLMMVLASAHLPLSNRTLRALQAD